MANRAQILLAAVAAAIVAALLVLWLAGSNTGAMDKESVYDRVLRTGVLRCAYFVVPPEFMKDPNTGQLSGIGYEVTEAATQLLGLRVEWPEEVGFGEMAAGFATGRYDAVCSSLFNRAPLARQADFTVPFMYTPVGIFVRADDTRFDADIGAINNPEIRILSLDGDTANEIATQDFPRAKKIFLPQNSDISMQLESVASQKADVAFTYMANFFKYDQTNPGKLKSLVTDRPIRAFGNTIMVPPGEDKLKSMLNTALNELMNSGTVDAIIDKYEPYPGAYYKVDIPYRVPPFNGN